MNPPFRIFGIAEGETRPSWFLTRDAGVSFTRADHDQRQVRLCELTLVGHGYNDQNIAKLFPRQQRAAFQAVHKYTDST